MAPPADANTYKQGATVTVLGNMGNLVKTGSTFAGWNTMADGTGTDLLPGFTFTMGSVDIILYAKWTTTYVVTYDGNGNTSGSVPTDSNNYQTGASATVLDNTGNLGKTNHVFAGWNTKADGTGTTYAAGSSLSIGTANVTLYAVFVSAKTIVFTGDSNTKGTFPSPCYAVYATRFASEPPLLYHWNSFNEGVGGTTSTDWVVWVSSKIINHSPDYVTIMLGTNDSNGVVPLATYDTNMRSIVIQIRADVPLCKILLITPPMVDETGTNLGSRNNTTISTYAQKVRDLGTELGIPTYDLWADMAADNSIHSFFALPDGMHLNDKAHILIYNHIIAWIYEMG